MKTREEQIAEMAKDLEQAKYWAIGTIGSLNNGFGGWYGEYMYNQGYRKQRRIQNQLTNFAENPSECFWFYIVKIASMWNENTFGSIWYNLSFNFGNMSVNEGQATEEQVSNYNKVDNFIYNNYNLFVMYDKIIVMFIYVAVLLFILRNKNISNEQILPILIFLGGFLFHIFWEGKSRYVMPYVVMLIPIASIGIKENIQWIGTKVNKTKNKFNKKTKDKI